MGRLFLSSDDLRINLWNLNHAQQSLTVVDMKPGNMDDLTEVITSTTFHPKDCSTFLYSSSKGALKIGDLRQSTTVSSFDKSFEMEEDSSSKTFFSEIISSISDAKFSPDGQMVIARDYMTVKVWDVRYERKPQSVLLVHEGLRPRLGDLYENDSIFDKFEVSTSADANLIYTGSYRNNFIAFDVKGNVQDCIEASRSSSKRQSAASSSSKTAINSVGNNTSSSSTASGSNASSAFTNAAAAVVVVGSSGNSNGGSAKKVPIRKREDYEIADFAKKVLHLSVHPVEDLVAVSAVNNLYIYGKVAITNNNNNINETSNKPHIN